jgi:hypothetical protein
VQFLELRAMRPEESLDAGVQVSTEHSARGIPNRHINALTIDGYDGSGTGALRLVHGMLARLGPA